MFDGEPEVVAGPYSSCSRHCRLGGARVGVGEGRGKAGKPIIGPHLGCRDAQAENSGRSCSRCCYGLEGPVHRQPRPRGAAHSLQWKRSGHGATLSDISCQLGSATRSWTRA